MSILLAIVLGGCVADTEAPPPVDREPSVEIIQAAGDDMDVCALASELPTSDICSLMCDPPAMAARMVADGNDTGVCYQLICPLPDDQSVLVGVCLPPP